MSYGNLDSWTPQEVLFFAYLTTLPAGRATRVLGIWDERHLTFSQYATAVISGIPPEFFLRPLHVPALPRFVFHNRLFTLQTTPDNNVPDQPLDLRPFVEQWRPSGAPVRPPGRARSMNSFMVFRAFIAPILGSATQMDKSRAISLLWMGDPLKPFWSVLAQAYTVLRDHFELPDPTLATFLGNVVTFMGIPPATAYITCLGYSIVRRPNGQGFSIIRSGLGNVGSLPLDPVSVYQVVNFCRHTLPDYARKRPDSTWPLTSIGESTMPIDTRNIIAIGPNTSTSLVPRPADPLWWLLNSNVQHAEDPTREFTARDLYHTPDVTIGDNLIFVPASDEFRQDHQNRQREAENSQFLPGFPYLDAIRDTESTS